jgi:hypothetical protein
MPKISVMAIAVHYGQKPSEYKSKCEVLLGHAKKAYRGSRGIAPLILSSAVDGGKRPNSRPGRFTLWIKDRYPLNGRLWCTPEPVWIKKKFPPAGIRTPDRLTSILVTKPTTMYAVKFDLNFINSVLECILGFQS